MPKIIDDELWFTDIEISDFLNDPNNAIAHVDDPADVLATIGEQMRSDVLVDDLFDEALIYDTYDGSDEYDEGLLYETLNLCDIVEAVEKGHIIYNG